MVCAGRTNKLLTFRDIANINLGIPKMEFIYLENLFARGFVDVRLKFLLKRLQNVIIFFSVIWNFFGFKNF